MGDIYTTITSQSSTTLETTARVLEARAARREIAIAIAAYR